jgi:hypothetical protein
MKGGVINKNSTRCKAAVFILLLTLAACNSYNPKDGGIQPTQLEIANPGLDTFQKYITEPYCVRCHSESGGDPKGVNLENYNNILLNLNAILQETVVKKTMPPGNPLPASDQQLIINWIANGAPQSGSNPAPHPNPVPTPPPLPLAPFNLQPTWTSISQNFNNLCMKCHGPAGKASKYPVNDLQFMLTNKIVVPGDLLNSKLFKEISTGKMPPKGPYDPVDIQAIGDWIQQGANNN